MNHKDSDDLCRARACLIAALDDALASELAQQKKRRPGGYGWRDQPPSAGFDAHVAKIEELEHLERGCNKRRPRTRNQILRIRAKWKAHKQERVRRIAAQKAKHAFSLFGHDDRLPHGGTSLPSERRDGAKYLSRECFEYAEAAENQK